MQVVKALPPTPSDANSVEKSMVVGVTLIVTGVFTETRIIDVLIAEPIANVP